jgi:hypothetical protein
MRARNGVPHLDSWLAPRWSRGGAALARPTMAAAAIRIPERMSAQLALVFPTASPQLFVHEGARQALERKLKASCPGRPVVLSITDNRHSIISHSMKNGVLHARIHHMFLDAPPRVVDALVRYVVRGDRDASLLVGHFIEANGARLARRRPRAIPLEAKGKHHDLLAIFKDLNEKYFDASCHALVTWGRRTRRHRRGPRRLIRLGSYSSLERLIRIHPVLDKPWVPRYFVAYVLYHEMLHHVIPAARGNGRAAAMANVASTRQRRPSQELSARGQVARRVLHPPEFLERERAFRRYERALEWEKRHIGRLLRASG